MPKEAPKHYKSKKTWSRFFFMIIFALIYCLAEMVVFAVIVLQALNQLWTGKKNQYLLEFGQGLCLYFYDIFQYLTYNTENKPFPFASWKKKGEIPSQNNKEEENLQEENKEEENIKDLPSEEVHAEQEKSESDKPSN